MDKISVIAMDLGGVLATQNWKAISPEELALVKAYLNRNNPQRVASEAAKTGCDDPAEFLKRAENAIGELYPKVHVLPPESIEALKIIRGNQYIPSIWTNNIREINPWFHQIGIDQLVDQIHICNSIDMLPGSNKPDERFYKQALSRIRRAPNEVYFIDDEPANVEAANRFGIAASQYDMTKSETTLDVYVSRLIGELKQR